MGICFGIIIPTFNRFEDLSNCLESIYSQEYKNWKIVVVDDASQGDYSHKYPAHKNVTFLKNSKNMGVCYSRNRGLDYLLNNESVDYITFLDDDDALACGSLANTANAIQKNSSPVWLVSRAIDLNSLQSITQVCEQKEEYNYLDDYLFGKSIKKDSIHYLSADFLKNESLRFNEDIKSGGEWRFFVQAAEKINFFFFEGGSSYKKYQEDGLTDLNKRNKLFIATERLAMLEYLQKQQKHFKIQARYMMSCTRKFNQLNDKAHLKYLFTHCYPKFNIFWRGYFRLYQLVTKFF